MTVEDKSQDQAEVVTDPAEDDGDQPMTLENARRIRAENKTLRDRAKDAEARADQADQYAQALFTARVEATGRLANAEELPFDAALLNDPDALNAAIDQLIERKPYVSARKFGEIGQGQRNETAPTDFSQLLR